MDFLLLKRRRGQSSIVIKEGGESSENWGSSRRGKKAESNPSGEGSVCTTASLKHSALLGGQKEAGLGPDKAA